MSIHDIIKEIENYNEKDLLELKETIDKINKRKRHEKIQKSIKKSMEINAEAMRELTNK